MRRVSYVLLATALSGPAPAVTIDDIAETGAETDATGTTLVATGRRPAAAGAASLVVERPVRDIARITCDGADAARAPIALLVAALRDCRRRGDLKVVVDLPLQLETVVARCEGQRFQYGRSARRGGRVVHEFYADLYSAERAPPSSLAESSPLTADS